MDREPRVLQPHSKECLEPPGAGRNKEGSPLEPSEDWGPVHTLISAISLPGLWKYKMPSVSAPRGCSFVLSPGNSTGRFKAKWWRWVGHNTEGLALAWGVIKISRTRKSYMESYTPETLMQHGEQAPGPHLCKAPRAVLVEEENPKQFNSINWERKSQERLWPGQGEDTSKINTGVTG